MVKKLDSIVRKTQFTLWMRGYQVHIKVHKLRVMQYRKGNPALKQSIGNCTHRYSVVQHQAKMAIEHSKRLSKKKVDIRKISQMTGFSEEQILESMEFGDPDFKIGRPTLPKRHIHLDL